MKANIKTGDVFYGVKGGVKGYKYHVVAVLDKEKETQVVFKFYGKHKQWWHYEVWGIGKIEMYFNGGLFSFSRNKQVET